MDLNWEKLFKRYVWHDERTPYLTRVANLTRIQAQYEIFGYALFMGVLAAVLSIVTLRAQPAAWRRGDRAASTHSRCAARP